MNIVTLVLLAFSGDGYWISGHTGTVEVRWNVKAPASQGDSILAWEIRCSGARLAAGRTRLVGDRKPTEIRVQAPPVRAITTADFVYRIELAADHKLLTEGKRSVHLYPDGLLSTVASRMNGKRLLVWDRPEALPSFLTKAKIKHTVVRSTADLQFTSPDIVLVGGDQLGQNVSEQSNLLNLAAAGVNVMIFRQTQSPALASYTVTRRAPPVRLAWLEDHPLARERAVLDPAGKLADLWAIRLPADEPALEIAWWPPETVGKGPVPMDALVIAKAIGRGRLVLCQLPLSPWHSDPRSQLFLATALDYLLSPAQPTPPPSQRGQVVKPRLQEVPTITFPSGGSQ